MTRPTEEPAVRDASVAEMSVTYEAALAEVESALALHRSLAGRGRRRFARGYRSAPGGGLVLGRTQRACDALATRLRDDERDLPAARIATAPFFVEALARHLRQSLAIDRARATALLAMHAEMEKYRGSWGVKLKGLDRFRTLAVAVAAVLASQVPIQSFEAIGLGSHTYGAYRIIVFAVLLLVLFYLYWVKSAMPDVVRLFGSRLPKEEARRFGLSREAERLDEYARLALLTCQQLDAFDTS
jgi:hypothetical protein